MRRIMSFFVLFGLAPVLAGCGLPDAVAQGVKSVERSFGSSEPPPKPSPTPPPARAANEPPPPVAVQRDTVKVEELR